MRLVKARLEPERRRYSPGVDLHDAMLRRLVVDWGAASLRIELATSEGDRVIEASGLQRLVVGHSEEWGRSVNINGVSRPSDHILEIEMQSGDVVSVEAAELVLPV